MDDKQQVRTPGEMISDAREARELTIAQLSERTKIPPPVLTALEMDEYHKISGPLYIKSFLRTCAVDLGLDPEEVLGLYNKISGEDPAGNGGSDKVWDEQQVQVSRIGLPWLRIVLVVGLGAVLIGVGLFLLRGCGSEEVGPVPSTDVVSPGDISGSPPETAPVPEESPVVVPADSLSRGGLLTPTWAEANTQGIFVDSPAETLSVAEEAIDPVADVPEQQVEESPPESVASAPVENVPEPAKEAVIITAAGGAAEDAVETSPDATPADAYIDSSWPLVLSITCDAPQDLQVKRDGDREFATVRWPAAGETPPDVPAAGFQAGRAYGMSGRLVVFWGAEDHFSLKLARIRGVGVSVNGRARDISKLRPGQEIILDSHSAGSSAGR